MDGKIYFMHGKMEDHINRTRAIIQENVDKVSFKYQNKLASFLFRFILLSEWGITKTEIYFSMTIDDMTMLPLRH